jgi:serine/threonine-protein kinase RsbW
MVHHVEVAKADGTRLAEAASVLIRVPAHKDYLVVVRSAVAQLGARLGYTFAEIIDLRLAVDEACCLLVAGDAVGLRAKGDLECRLEVRDDGLRLEVTAASAGFEPPDPEGFGWNVLTALVDAVAWAQDDDTARIMLDKRRDVRSP